MQEHWQQCPALWHLFEHQFSVLFRYHAVYDHMLLFSSIQIDRIYNVHQGCIYLCIYKKNSSIL